jgi:hypothetical protein
MFRDGFRLTDGVASDDNPLLSPKAFAAFPKRDSRAPGCAVGGVNSP